MSKNPQIKLWHRRLGHTSNAKVVEVAKFNNRIDIAIKNDHITKNLSFDSEKIDKDKCEDLGQTFTANNKHERLLPLINAINNINGPDNSKIERLCDPYIESKHIKIVRYKKITPTTKKLQKIHADL